MMLFLYLSQFLLVMLALAAIGHALSARLGMKALAAAFLSAAGTPHVLASFVVALAWVWPGAPKLTFLALPAAVALSTLVALRTHTAALAVAIGASFRFGWVVGLVQVATVLCALFLVTRLLIAANAPLIGHDALIYLTEAKAFAQERSITAIPNFDADAGEIVKTHPHRFFWQAYLAQALMATDGEIGFPHDLAARGAMLITLPLLAGAAISIAAVTVSGWYACLALPLLLLLGQIGYIPVAASVDAFRTIPFIALVALIITLVGRTSNLSLATWVAIGVLTTLCAVSHTINQVFLLILFAGMWFLALLRLISWPNVFLSGSAALVLVLPTIEYYLENWATYGSPLGLGFDYIFYKGTPLWDRFVLEGSWTKPHSFVQAAIAYGHLHGFVVLVPAIILSVLAIAFGLKCSRLRRLAALAFIFLLEVLGPLLPIGREVTLQGAMLSNPRYGLLVLSLAPVMIAAATGAVERFMEGQPRIRSFWLVCVIALNTILCVMGMRAVLNWKINTPELARSYLDRNELFLSALADQLPPNSNWAVDRFTPAYFTGRPPIKLASSAGKPVLQANTFREAEHVLDVMKIRMVAIHAPDWWEQTVLFQFLESRPLVQRRESEGWKIFMLPPNASSWRELREPAGGILLD